MGISKTIGAAALAILFVSSAVISERTASRQAGSDRIVITYWEKWTKDEMRAMKTIVDRYNASQDKVYVKMLSISGIAEKTLLSTSGGNPPDVAGLWADQVCQFGDANALLDMMPYLQKYGIKPTDYISSYWKDLVYKGKLFALPTSPGSSALYVNEELMPPEYNTPEKFPKTLSQLDDLIEKVTVRGKNGKLERLTFMPRSGYGGGSWPYLFGGAFVHGDKITVNDKDNLRAWTWVTGFAKRFGMAETQQFQSSFGVTSSQDNPFIAKRLACMMEGPWFANFIRQYGPKTKWFAVPMPYPDDRPDCAGYTVLNLNTLMIPRGAKHPDEAFDFIAFVQKQENMELLCRLQYCNTPLNKVSEEFLTTHPNKCIRVFDQLARSPRAVGRERIGFLNQITSEVGNAVDQMDLGEKMPQQALDDAQRRLDEGWAKYQKQVLGR